MTTAQDCEHRPGLPTVVRLPNGTYAMSIEDCKAEHDAEQVCIDHLKFSPGGQDWTPVSSLGTAISTAQGCRLLVLC